MAFAEDPDERGRNARMPMRPVFFFCRADRHYLTRSTIWGIPIAFSSDRLLVEGTPMSICRLVCPVPRDPHCYGRFSCHLRLEIDTAMRRRYPGARATSSGYWLTPSRIALHRLMATVPALIECAGAILPRRREIGVPGGAGRPWAGDSIGWLDGLTMQPPPRVDSSRDFNDSARIALAICRPTEDLGVATMR